MHELPVIESILNIVTVSYTHLGMNRERAKGVLAFFVLFLVGLAIYSVFDAALAPSKPMVQELSLIHI